MTIAEAIQTVDAQRNNVCTMADKVAWLSEIDGKIKHEIIDTHADAESVPFDGYTVDTSMNTELIAEAPYDALYIPWLESCIDRVLNETTRYNNSITRFNDKYDDYARYYNRTHMPLGKRIRFW